VAKQRFGLGRGLDALISGASEVMAAQQPGRPGAEAVTEVPVESIIPNPRQPRRIFREDDPKLLELSASIKEYGLIQPLIVTRLQNLPHEAENEQQSTAWFDTPQDGRNTSVERDASFPTETATGSRKESILYQIIAGERRWRAARLAGLTRVPVVIKEVTPQQMLEMALIENIQRADLNPIEEALAYQSLIQDFGMTQEMVAKRVGKDRSTITNSLRLLQLAPKVREMLMSQSPSFTEGHARALVGIARDEDQITAMNKIIAMHLNVRQAEELAARIKAGQDQESALRQMAPAPTKPPEIAELEAQFRSALMVKVDLRQSAKGKGTLVLHFNDQEELERLYSRLVKREE
jgi:ParB family chromosome partitioning protein